MSLRTHATRVAVTLLGLTTAVGVSAPVAAQACDQKAGAQEAGAQLGYGNLAHSAEISRAGAPAATRSYARGTGYFLGDPDYSIVGGRPLVGILPKEHGTVYWQDADAPDRQHGLSQELTEAPTYAAAHDVGMALYGLARRESGHARHAIPIDGGTLTWFHVDDQGPGYTVSVIRVGRRVSVVSLAPQPAHQKRLLVAIADRMR